MTTLVRIGNSQGVRIPKAIIEQAKLANTQLTFKVVDDGLLIVPIKKVRDGWQEKFECASTCTDSANSDREWLDSPLVDDEDWQW